MGPEVGRRSSIFILLTLISVVTRPSKCVNDQGHEPLSSEVMTLYHVTKCSLFLSGYLFRYIGSINKQQTLTESSPVSFRMLNTRAAGEFLVDGAKL